MEYYRVMQNLCMYIGPIFTILAIVCGLGYNHYGSKIKSLEKVENIEYAKPKDTVKKTYKKVKTAVKQGNNNSNKVIGNNNQVKNNEYKNVDNSVGKSGNNVSGDNNIVNQSTTNNYSNAKADRHVTNDDLKLLSTIPLDYTVKLTIEGQEPETYQFANEVNAFLNLKGYKIIVDQPGQMVGVMRKRMVFTLQPQDKVAYITILEWYNFD